MQLMMGVWFWLVSWVCAIAGHSWRIWCPGVRDCARCRHWERILPMVPGSPCLPNGKLTTELTESDQLRAEFGLLPIDVDPPRPLTHFEIKGLTLTENHKTLMALGFEPMAHKGFLAWRKRG